MKYLLDVARSTARQHVGVYTAGRIDRFRNRMIVVAGNNDRISVRIDPADDADMAAAASAHDGDGADLWAGDSPPVMRE